jgi:ATP-dependent DNA helicase PIF1
MTPVLNEGQQYVYNEIITNRQNACIIGPGGVGKSILVDKLRVNIKGSQVLAPTGVAAINVSGVTIHRFFGITPNIFTLRDYKNYRRKTKSPVKWYNLKCLIIDEISMVHPDLFNLIDEISRYYLKSSLPFGGLQIIIVGDWYQLPPVKGIFIYNTDLYFSLNFVNHSLSQNMRQTDIDFVNILNNIRIGNVDEDVTEFLKKLINNKKRDEISYVKLYSKNIDKRFANEAELSAINSPEVIHESIDIGDKRYLSGCIVENELVLKKTSRVMLLRNMPYYGLCNGSCGTVVEFDKICKTPIVKFDSGITIPIDPVKFEIFLDRKVIASRTQFPLTLAYAISVHKSQGLTFDAVQFFCDGIFERGQFYTGVSRCKSSDNLILEDFDITHIITK